MRIRCAMLLAVLLMAANLACAADDSPLLATEPTINKTEIVFVYGGYLWGVSRAGGEARQLTTGGHESSPHFSPDGKWIAFTGQYDGNEDVYVMPAEGGEPRRLTWHPANDGPVGWTPDGKRVAFISTRDAWADVTRIYTVPVEGGVPEVLPMWRAFDGSYSPDGKSFAFEIEVATGPLVGTKTWGGLVGIYNYPPLMDGGGVTAPRVAIYGAARRMGSGESRHRPRYQGGKRSGVGCGGARRAARKS